MKKKIAFVIPTLQAGGMERVMSEIVNFLSVNSNSFEIHLILLIKKERFYVLNKSIQIHETPFRKKSKLFYTVRTAVWLRAVVKKLRPICIISFGEYWNSFVLSSLILTKSKVIVSDRSNPLDTLNGIHEIMRSFLYRYANGFIAQTRLAEQKIINKTGIQNTLVIGNPIREIVQSDHEKKWIISVGRLIKTKQHSLLIDIFSKAARDGWHLKILGDGPCRKNLEAQIKKMNLEDNVELVGEVKDVDEYLGKASIFAFTSSYEGFPNALAEAMKAGLACISFDCSAGPSEIIRNGVNGYLIPMNNELLYLEKLNKLISSKELRKSLGIRAREDMKNYDLSKVCEDVLRFTLKTADK